MGAGGCTYRNSDKREKYATLPAHTLCHRYSPSAPRYWNDLVLSIILKKTKMSALKQGEASGHVLEESIGCCISSGRCICVCCSAIRVSSAVLVAPWRGTNVP